MSGEQDQGTEQDQSSAGGDGSILGRLRAAGIGEERARAWLASDGVRVEGETVTDPDAPAPWPTRWTFTST